MNIEFPGSEKGHYFTFVGVQTKAHSTTSISEAINYYICIILYGVQAQIVVLSCNTEILPDKKKNKKIFVASGFQYTQLLAIGQQTMTAIKRTLRFSNRIEMYF